MASSPNSSLPSAAVFPSLNVAMAGLGPLPKRCMFIRYSFIGFPGLLFSNHRKRRKSLWLGSMWKEWNICSIPHIMAVVSLWSELGLPGDCSSGLGREAALYLGKRLSIRPTNRRPLVSVLVSLGYKRQNAEGTRPSQVGTSLLYHLKGQGRRCPYWGSFAWMRSNPSPSGAFFVGYESGCLSGLLLDSSCLVS